MNAVQELSGATVTANLLTGLGVDELFTRTDSGGARNFLTDGLGSTLGLTDSTGAVQTQYTYEAFGKTTTSGPANASTFQYTERENDGTGLYYYRARYYHPTLQRFISEDPLGFGGGDINLYAYAGNDPLGYTDPSGFARKDNPRGPGGPGSPGGPASPGNPHPTRQCGDFLCQANGHDPDLTKPHPIGLQEDFSVELAASALAQDVVAAQGMAADALFQRGTGLLNDNPYLRVGWGWNNNIGSEVFRIAIGSRPTWTHIDMWTR